MVQYLQIPPDEYHSKKKSKKQIQLHSLDFLSDLNKHLNKLPFAKSNFPAQYTGPTPVSIVKYIGQPFKSRFH